MGTIALNFNIVGALRTTKSPDFISALDRFLTPSKTSGATPGLINIEPGDVTNYDNSGKFVQGSHMLWIMVLFILEQKQLSNMQIKLA